MSYGIYEASYVFYIPELMQYKEEIVQHIHLDDAVFTQQHKLRTFYSIKGYRGKYDKLYLFFVLIHLSLICKLNVSLKLNWFVVFRSPIIYINIKRGNTLYIQYPKYISNVCAIDVPQSWNANPLPS